MKTRAKQAAAYSALLLMLALRALGQTVPGSIETNTIKFHEALAARFKSGETNLPLVLVDSLGPTLYFWSVERTGAVIAGFYNGVSNAGGNRPPLSPTNLQAVAETLNRLPASAVQSLPLKKQLHISGIRSNGWFHVVYDLDNPPEEAERLSRLVGARYRN